MSKPTPDDLPESYFVSCDVCGEHEPLFGESGDDKLCYGCMQENMDTYPELFEDDLARGDDHEDEEDDVE